MSGFPFDDFFVDKRFRSAQSEAVSFAGNIHGSEIFDIPSQYGISRKSIINAFGYFLPCRPTQFLLGRKITVMPDCIGVHAVETVHDTQRIARQSDAAFDVSFKHIHLDFIPSVRVGDMKNNYIVMFDMGVSGSASDFYFFPFEGIEKIEEARSVSRFIDYDIVSGDNSRYHRICGYAVWSEDKHAQQQKANDNDWYTIKYI